MSNNNLYPIYDFDFCIMKKLWDLAHEKLVNILGGRVGILPAGLIPKTTQNYKPQNPTFKIWIFNKDF